MSSAPPLVPEEALLETVRFTALQAALWPETPASAAWLVSGAVLMAQQAAAIALRAAGDSQPQQVGAAELLLRAAHRDRLPPPYTLPFSSSARLRFGRLVDARNLFMHPRGTDWQVSPETLCGGLPVATAAVRHLILVQPVLSDLIAPRECPTLEAGLAQIDAVADFIGTGDTDPLDF